MAALNGPLSKLVQSNACAPTGINELSSSTVVNLYPNPSSGTFTIKLSGINDELYHADIYDLLGEDVYSTISHNPIEINLSNCPNGIYLLRLSDENSTIVKKLVINK